MHEQSIMNDLMQKITALAKEQHATKITQISVRLGALSHFTPSHFQEHFDIVSKGTLAEGAHIDAEESTDFTDPNALNVVLKSINVTQ